MKIFVRKVNYLKLTTYIVLSLSFPLSAEDLPYLQAPLPQPYLQGNGKFTYFGLHIYDAALYRSRINDSQEFALNIRYRRSFSGKSIAEQSIQEMKKLGYSSTQLNQWSKELVDVFPDVEAGHSLTAMYKPKQGTIFFYNGQKISEVQGAEFSKAFFSIWLDSKTSAPSLRHKLLAQSCPPPLINEVC